MTTEETIKLIDIITNQLNDFFGKISIHNYQFENTTEHKKNEADQKSKMLKKAYRIFKKQFNKQSVNQQLGEKQKQRLINNQWIVLSQADKMKYLQINRKMDKKNKKKKLDEDFKPNQ